METIISILWGGTWSAEFNSLVQVPRLVVRACYLGAIWRGTWHEERAGNGSPPAFPVAEHWADWAGRTFQDFPGAVGLSGMPIELVRDGGDGAKGTADDCGWSLSFTNLQHLRCGWFFPSDAQQSFCEADALCIFLLCVRKLKSRELS